MKFENILLHVLFSACLLVCLTVIGTMLTARTPASTFAANPIPQAVASQPQV